VFTLVHTAMVLIQDAPGNLGRITLATARHPGIAVAISLRGVGAIRTSRSRHAGIAVVAAEGAANTRRSARSCSPRALASWPVPPVLPAEQVSARPWVRPPTDEEYRRLAGIGFTDWRLEVTGLVERPLCLSLEDLRACRRRPRPRCTTAFRRS
jgi:DMSO/TMAO reductase YedYZ molybdopterin-dependent catalytic subunit